MPEITFEAKIAVGNNNAGGLTLITSLTASSIPFIQVAELSTNAYSRGTVKTATSGVDYYAWYKSKTWGSSLLWLPQYEYLISTYEGLVTIRTRLSGNTYANYNAVLSCGNLDEYELVHESKYGMAIVNFQWKFTRIEAI